MKVVARLFVMALVAGMLYAFSGPVLSPFNENNGAFIEKDFMCGMFDADGGYYITNEGNISVITGSGKYIVVCQAFGVPNSTGKAQQFQDFYCRTPYGYTTDSQENISASGQAVLKCRTNIE